MKQQSPFAILILVVILGLSAGLAYVAYKASGSPHCAWIGVVGLVVGMFVFSAIKIADQWERVVVLRLGKFHSLRGPGLFFIVPIIDSVPYWIALLLMGAGAVKALDPIANWPDF